MISSLKIFQRLPIPQWLKVQLLLMAHQCLPDLFPAPLEPYQAEQSQCPQASGSLLTLFPLSGMPFLHVLLLAIHLQLRDHFLQGDFLNSFPTR